MMNNSDRLDKSAKAESLYKFFKDNAFLTSGNVQLKSNYSRGKESPWSLAFAGHCVKDVFKIDDPMFCSKFVQAISGDGQEANKIMTLHSSSLASLLVFYSVSKDNPIYVMVDGKEEKFTESLFEVKNEVSDGSGNFSNVDVVLRGDNCILYLESKFSEYLGSGPVEVKMVDYYDTIYEGMMCSDYAEQRCFGCEKLMTPATQVDPNGLCLDKNEVTHQPKFVKNDDNVFHLNADPDELIDYHHKLIDYSESDE